MAESSVGYDCSLVDPISKDLQVECSICLLLLREPYLVSCCGYRFCHKCIQKVSSQKRPCPLCNSKTFGTFPDKLLDRILKEKLVHCCNKENGCTWKGNLADFEKHKTTCDYNTFFCRYCRGDVPFSISKCKETHYDVCSMYPVECPNGCGSSHVRSCLLEHIDKSCPLTEVDCAFKCGGCNVRLPRKEMGDHEAGVSGHLRQMFVKISQLTEENKALKKEMESKDRKFRALQDRAELRERQLRPFLAKCLSVSNRPHGASKAQIKDVFSKYGRVERIDFIGPVTEIEYASENSAKSAVQQSKKKGLTLLATRLSVEHLLPS